VGTGAQIASTGTDVALPWPGLLTQPVGVAKQHIPVPAAADKAAIDLDVVDLAGGLVMATGLPGHRLVRLAEDRRAAGARPCAKSPAQLGRVDHRLSCDGLPLGPSAHQR
jgi:hypothetical protein